MNLVRSIAVLAIAVFLAVAAQAQSAGQVDCSALVDRALTLSGLDESIKHAVDESISELSMPSDAPKSLVRQTKQLISRELDARVLRAAVREQFMKNCHEETLQRAIELMQTPEMQLILEAERQAHSAETSEETEAFLRELRKRTASADRITMLNDLDRGLKWSETLAEMQIGVMVAMLDGAGINAGIEENDIELSRAMIRSAERKSLLKWNLFTYRNLSDDEVRAYVKLCQKGPLHDFEVQLISSTGEAFLQAAARMGRQFPAIVERVKAESGQ